MLQTCGTLIAISMDGASVMSGHISGVQARLKTSYPWLVYIHCNAHQLNLIIINLFEKTSCKDCISTLDSLYTFSTKQNRDLFEKCQLDLEELSKRFHKDMILDGQLVLI